MDASGLLHDWRGMMDWIKITHETMPTENEWVLVTSIWRREKSVKYAQYQGGEFLSEVEDNVGGRWEISGVTHWMHMPEPAED